MRGDWPDNERRYGARGGGTAHDPDRTRILEQVDDRGGPLIGRRYRLERLLESDAVAEIYSASDVELNRPVVVTLFRQGLDNDAARRFLDVARPLTTIHHPGLVAVLDAGVEGGRGYLVREQVDGQTLRSAIAARPLPPAQVARIGAQLAEALATLHDHGMAHRDVTPDNVVLGRDGRARLADLGIAPLAGLLASREPGSAAYLSPEQVRRQPAGLPADVYALGLVLLEALTGRQEYPGTGWEAASARLSRPPEIGNDVPGPWAQPLLAMTATAPGNRPTARDAASMLAAAGGSDATPVGAEPPSKNTGLRIAAIALPVVILLGLIAYLATNQDDEEPSSSRSTTTATAKSTPTTRATATRAPSGSGESRETGSALPSFSAPDIKVPELPELPDAPSSIGDDLENLWKQFTDWLATVV